MVTVSYAPPVVSSGRICTRRSCSPSFPAATARPVSSDTIDFTTDQEDWRVVAVTPSRYHSCVRAPPRKTRNELVCVVSRKSAIERCEPFQGTRSGSGCGAVGRGRGVGEAATVRLSNSAPCAEGGSVMRRSSVGGDGMCRTAVVANAAPTRTATIAIRTTVVRIA
jgi:hypothetical protein